MSWKALTFLAALAVPIATTLPANAATTSSVPTATLTSSHGTTQQAVSSSLDIRATTPLSGHSLNGTNPLSGGKTTPKPITTPSSAGVATTGTSKGTTHTPVSGASQPPVQQHAPTGPPAVHEWFDSAAPNGIPPSAKAVAGYVTGPYTWSPQQWAMFPHAQPLTIDIIGGDTHAMIEDVEPGGVPVGVIHQWAVSRLQQGYTPVIYSSVSDYPAVAAAMTGLHWHWWAANPGGAPVPGAAATQVQWNGNSFDYSTSTMTPAQLIRSLFDRGCLTRYGDDLVRHPQTLE